MPDGANVTAGVPVRRAILETALFAATFAIVGGAIGFAGGILEWAPTASGLVPTLLIALAVPSLVEELVFRGPLLLVPKRAAIRAVPLSAGLFVLWHPLQVWLGLPFALDAFAAPAFLTVAGTLGLTLAVLTVRTRRLFPAVLVHWAVVVVWKQLLGG